MMAGTAMIAFMPPYASIGPAVPVLVIVARMIQGFSVSGEFGSATALLAEQDPDRRSFYASLQWAASGFAVLLASLSAYAVNTLLTPNQVADWGWRVPFMFGLLIGTAAIYIRSRLHERDEFLRAEHPDRPMAELVATDKLRVLLAPALLRRDRAAAFSTRTCRLLPSQSSACRNSRRSLAQLPQARSTPCGPRSSATCRIAYWLAQTLFGGVTPLVVGWIMTTTGDPTSPSIYLVAVMLLSLGCLAASVRPLGGPRAQVNNAMIASKGA